jgi:hypothetical protein
MLQLGNVFKTAQFAGFSKFAWTFFISSCQLNIYTIILFHSTYIGTFLSYWMEVNNKKQECKIYLHTHDCIQPKKEFRCITKWTIFKNMWLSHNRFRFTSQVNKIKFLSEEIWQNFSSLNFILLSYSAKSISIVSSSVCDNVKT